MVKAIGKVALLSMFASVAMYAASTAGCVACHGKNFEKKALGKSKIVKDMSKEDIVKALKGYKDGTYGGAMKGSMKGQVANLSDADMAALADAIKGGGDAKAAPAAEKAAPAAEKPAAPAAAALVEDNIESGKTGYDLTGKKEVAEVELGLRKTALGQEDTAKPVDAKFDAPAPGASKKFARSYVNAPPLVPHSVEGLLPITQKNNQCLGCHMPDVAKGVGATPIPASHFTNYRPTTVYKDGELVKEGQTVGMKGKLGNTSDIKLAKVKKLDHLYQGRFNCSQCHVPQANVKPLVKNNFRPDFTDKKFKGVSNLTDVMTDGVK
jgi:cytochrome c-type protein NapB